jgi:hypothetical protein
MDFFSWRNVHAFQTSLRRCKIFLTDNGHLGIGPEATVTKDVVCILRGADSACILRQKEGRLWSLVSGDCHLLDERYELDDDLDGFSCEIYLKDGSAELEEFDIC